jgi:hypothetical protein
MHAASDRSGIFHAQLLVFDALHAGMREPIDGQGVFMLLNPRGASHPNRFPHGDTSWSSRQLTSSRLSRLSLAF